MILTALDDVRPGMALAAPLHNSDGQTLLGPGEILTPVYLARLRAFGCYAVWIDDEDTRDIVCEDPLTEKTRLAIGIEIQNMFGIAAREAPAFRSASVRHIRDALESRRFHRAYDYDAGVKGLTGQVNVALAEILDRPLLNGVGSVRSHATYSIQHGLDVMVTAAAIGQLLGYDRQTLRKLALGCALHDVGKVFIQDEILAKPDPLTPEESQRLRDHTVFGYLMIRDSLALGILAAHVAYQHHERQDGQGYPRGLTGTNRITRGLEVHMPGHIVPLAEVAAIADFHDSRSSERPYRKAFPPDRVWQMIQDASGTRFNREIADLALSILPPYPVGTRVAVTGGQWAGCAGVVSRIDRKALPRPVIRVLTDESGERVKPFEIDLRSDDATVRGVG